MDIPLGTKDTLLFKGGQNLELRGRLNGEIELLLPSLLFSVIVCFLLVNNVPILFETSTSGPPDDLPNGLFIEQLPFATELSIIVWGAQSLLLKGCCGQVILLSSAYFLIKLLPEYVFSGMTDDCTRLGNKRMGDMKLFDVCLLFAFSWWEREVSESFSLSEEASRKLPFKKEEIISSSSPSFNEVPNSGSPRRLLALCNASLETDIDLPPAVWNLIGGGFGAGLYISDCLRWGTASFIDSVLQEVLVLKGLGTGLASSLFILFKSSCISKQDEFCPPSKPSITLCFVMCSWQEWWLLFSSNPNNVLALTRPAEEILTIFPEPVWKREFEKPHPLSLSWSWPAQHVEVDKFCLLQHKHRWINCKLVVSLRL